jgi:hypothetical protein
MNVKMRTNIPRPPKDPKAWFGWDVLGDSVVFWVWGASSVSLGTDGGMGGKRERRKEGKTKARRIRYSGG